MVVEVSELLHGIVLLVLVLSSLSLLMAAASSLETWVEQPARTPVEAELPRSPGES